MGIEFIRLSILRSLRLVDENPSKSWASPELAQKAAIAEAYFSRTFREVMGMPPYQFVLERRLALARDLLLNSKNSISELSLKCGFKSISAFTNLFTREHHRNPSNWRAFK